MPQALAGGGAGSLGGDKGGFGSGGGGGGSGGDGGSGAGKGGEGSGEGGQQPKGKGWAWKGWSDRVAADPEFPFKVLLEQVRRAYRSNNSTCPKQPNSLRWATARAQVASAASCHTGAQSCKPSLSLFASPRVRRSSASEHLSLATCLPGPTGASTSWILCLQP